MKLRGIFPIVATPFTEAGALDEDALRRVVAFCLDCGVHGLVWPAVASEFYCLSDAERRRGVRLMLDAVDGRVPVVVGVSASHWQLAAELAEDAVSAGASALMAVPPYVVKDTLPGVRRYYEAICRAARGRGVILQNAPPPLGQAFSPSVVTSLVRGVPGITYVKEENLPSGHAVSVILADAPPGLEGVFGGGGGRQLIEEHRRGVCGAMPACEYADVFVTLWEALEAGRTGEARDRFERLLPLLMIEGVLRMAFTKEVLRRRGVIGCARVRVSGGLELDETDHAELDALSERIESDLTV